MGKVYLVGAGPGDPDLLTLRGMTAIQEADTVVFDRLISVDILRLARKGAKLIDVGKTPGGHSVPQGEINKILVREASGKNTVTRLKGGDPFVFGRGGEEALFLKECGIDFEIVSGVTSCVSVPAFAGIPVTHRGMASSFHVITGHEAPDKDEDAIDFKVVSKLSGTLVFLMGMKNLSYIVQSLVDCGKPRDTPCAVIMEGGTAFQKTVVGTLSDICSKAKARGMKNPSVIVVGEVVTLREKLQWYGRGNLFGKRVLFTGIDPHSQASGSAGEDPFTHLKGAGAEVIHAPTLKIVPKVSNVLGLLREISEWDILIFTSKNGVKVFGESMKAMRFDGRRLNKNQVWAIGPGTAKALEDMHIFPDAMPEEYTAKALAKMLAPVDINRKMAVITSNIGGEGLLESLRAYGAIANKIVAYETHVNYQVQDLLQRELERGIDAVIFSSPSTFDNFETLLGDPGILRGDIAIAAIGPTTRDAIEERGHKVNLMPREHTFEGLAREISEHLWRAAPPYRENPISKSDIGIS